MAKLKDLEANPKNPRKITEEKLKALKKTVTEFGDLSGIVYNRKTKLLVGAHQRVKILPPDAEIHFTKKYDKPTRVGTVAIGYVLYNGERFSYREVFWDAVKEKAANIAANKGGGEWDNELLSEWMREISDFGIDLDLTMFDENERADLLVDPAAFEAGKEEDQGKLDEKKKQVCPHCGESFLVGGRI